MPKQVKTRTEHPVDHFHGLEDVRTIADLRRWVDTIVSMVPDAFHENAEVMIGLGDYSNFSIFYTRPETAADRENDERLCLERTARKHAEERAQYERLRAKFETR